MIEKPTENQLNEYIEGTLDSPDEERIRLYLEQNPELGDEIEMERRIINELRKLKNIKAPSSIKSRVLDAITESQTPQKTRKSPVYPLVIAASLLIAGVISYTTLYMPFEPKESSTEALKLDISNGHISQVPRQLAEAETEKHASSASASRAPAAPSEARSGWAMTEGEEQPQFATGYASPKKIEAPEAQNAAPVEEFHVDKNRTLSRTRERTHASQPALNDNRSTAAPLRIPDQRNLNEIIQSTSGIKVVDLPSGVASEFLANSSSQISIPSDSVRPSAPVAFYSYTEEIDIDRTQDHIEANYLDAIPATISKEGSHVLALAYIPQDNSNNGLPTVGGEMIPLDGSNANFYAQTSDIDQDGDIDILYFGTSSTLSDRALKTENIDNQAAIKDEIKQLGISKNMEHLSNDELDQLIRNLKQIDLSFLFYTNELRTAAGDYVFNIPTLGNLFEFSGDKEALIKDNRDGYLVFHGRDDNQTSAALNRLRAGEFKTENTSTEKALLFKQADGSRILIPYTLMDVKTKEIPEIKKEE